MNLIIDQGNTRTKCAFFEGIQMVSHQQFDNQDIDKITQFISTQKTCNKSILSSVADSHHAITSLLHKTIPTNIFFDHNTPIPIINTYQNPHTLGPDRIAAAIGAHLYAPDIPALVFDLGTAITYEVVNEQGEYLGGGISPGLHMRFRALNTSTQALPLLNPTTPFPFIGSNTDDAIRAGVMSGILHELEGQIAFFRTVYPAIQIFFTGGDAKYFENSIKCSIFAKPFLVEEGLNRILMYNLG